MDESTVIKDFDAWCTPQLEMTVFKIFRNVLSFVWPQTCAIAQVLPRHKTSASRDKPRSRSGYKDYVHFRIWAIAQLSKYW